MKATVADALDEVRPGTRFGPSGDLHEIGEELGAGAAARVFSCVRLCTGEQLAVKVINLQRLQLLGDLEAHIQKLDREVQILRALRHERCVNLHNVHRTANWYFLVMERIRGGELFDQIVQHKSLSEMESRYVFRQLLEGVGYMHAKNVIHRDLKPENILIVNSQPIGLPDRGLFHDVKIADFGLSKVISETTSFAKTLVGTPQYYAPEVLNVQNGGGTYDQAADFWGLGVVLFVMLCGRYPFDGKKAPLEEQIRTASFNMNTKRWDNISEAAKDLVRGLLRVNPRERLRLEHCAYHPWVVDSHPGCGQSESSQSLPAWSSACVDPGECSPVLAAVAEEDCRHDPGYDAWHLDDDEEEPEHSAASCSRSRSRSEAPSGGSSCEVLGPSAESRSVSVEAEPADDAQLWLISRLWLCTAGRWWRRRRWATSALTSLCFLLLFAYVRPDLLRLRGDDALQGGLQVLPRLLTVHHLTVPTVPLLSRGSAGGSPFGASQCTPPPSSREGAGAPSCPTHPGDGALLEGCSPHSPPHPGMPPPIPGMGPRVSTGVPGGVDKGHYAQLGHDVGNNVSEFGEQETIFRLSELLKLQVSIAGSLEMARLAFRHANPELAEAIRQTSRQARDLFQHAANVVSRFAQVAQQVSQFVLPDLHLAVQEREPTMAAGLLEMVKDWVLEMKTEGERTQQRYVQLQAAVLSLAGKAQETKSGADRRLFEAVKAVEAEPSLSAVSQDLVLGRQLGSRLGVCEPSAKGDDVAGVATASSGSGGQQKDAGGAVNGWTKQLFEQLSELTAGSGKASIWDRAGDVPMISVEAGNNGAAIDDDQAWRRDLVDLLFLAPGIAPSSLPKLEPLTFAASASDAKDDEERWDDGVHVEDDSGESTAGTQRADPGNAVVRYVHTENVKSEAESATHSSAALLRALRELKRVDGILQGCSAFWANMDGTVKRLAQMKEHTASLVNFASKSVQLRARFEQRLGEYVSFWEALERLCRQYCQDHQAAAGRMNEFIREMTDAADLIDTAESAKAGVVLARKEKQLRHRYLSTVPA